jgi:hypothetical protein
LNKPHRLEWRPKVLWRVKIFGGEMRGGDRLDRAVLTDGSASDDEGDRVQEGSTRGLSNRIQ